MQGLEVEYDLAAVPELVERIFATFPGTRIFTLTGDLGAGKTTLVSAFCRLLGVKDDTSSPTFAIVNEYRSATGPIFHLDCYRLRDIDEALAIGVEEYLDEGRYVFIEWPEVIEPLLPLGVVHLRLRHLNAGNDEPRRALTATQATL